MIDGDALLCLTERALEMLIPVIGHRMKFLKIINELKQKNDSLTGNCMEEISDHQVNDCASASGEPQSCATSSGEPQSCGTSSTENEELEENFQTRLVRFD